MDERKVISLFSGCGGMDLGLEQAGFETVIANEMNPVACETLRRNKLLCTSTKRETERFIDTAMEQKCYRNTDRSFLSRLKATKKRKYLQEAKIIEADVRDLRLESFGINREIIDLIAGGPPCQPFSKAGKQKSLEDKTNGDLFYEFVRICKDVRPKAFLFENVKGLTFTKTEVAYTDCMRCNSTEIVEYKHRNAAIQGYSAPPCAACKSTKTKIVSKKVAGGSLDIILNEFTRIGYQCSYKVLNSADFGVPQVRERLFIVGVKSGRFNDWPKPTHRPFNYDGRIIKNLKPWKSMRSTIWSNGHGTFGKIKADAKLWVKNVVRPHDEPVTWDLDRPAPTIGAHQSAKLAFAPNGIPTEQLFRQQWHTLGRRQGDTKPVKVEHAYLSDRELLILQSFPSWWYLHGTRMQRAFQIGNAVPPALAKAIGIKIKNYLNELESKIATGVSTGRVTTSA